MTVWDQVYAERGMLLFEPHETLVQFVSRHLRRREGLDEVTRVGNGESVLDLGCGNGAQSIFLARLGLSTSGIDISAAAIDAASTWAGREGHEIDFRVADAVDLPFDDDTFDAVVSYAVLDHVLPADATIILNEVKRVLRRGGLLWLSLMSTETHAFGEGTEVAPRTYTVDDGFEAGTVQHYFDRDEVVRLVTEGGFEMRDLRHRVEERMTLGSGESTIDEARWFVTAVAVAR